MTAALSIALAAVCMASLAGAWWATRQIAAMATGLGNLVSSMSSLQTELLGVTLDRDRVRFELDETKAALADASKRLAALEEVLTDEAPPLSTGLAADDVRGRLLRRAQAAAGAASGGSVSANAGQAVSPSKPSDGAGTAVRSDLPDV